MSRYIKGLVRDTFPSDQPEGTWRYAKNAIVNRVDGTIGNEEGNALAVSIGRRKFQEGQFLAPIKGYKVIGTIEVTDDRIIVFSVHIDSTAQNEYGRCEIGMLYYEEGNLESMDYKTILNLPGRTSEIEGPNCKIIDTDFKFSTQHPITGTYKINSKQNLIIYWTDGKNPARSLNITRQLENIQNVFNDWYAGGGTATNISRYYEHIYGKFPETSYNRTYIDRLNLFPHAGPTPSIELQKVISGGGLVSGSYQLALAYVDKDLVATNYVVVDNPVPIVDDIESVLPIERYDGCPPGTQTGKSIVWRIFDYNTDYDYIRPAIIQHLGGERFAFQLHDIEVDSDNAPIVLTFSGTEGYQSSSVDDIVIDTIAYDTVKTMTQLDDVLYLGNLERNLDVGYQHYAGDIKLSAKIRTFDAFDEFSMVSDNMENGFIEMPPFETNKANGYRDPYNAYKRRGYTRGEVYAFYISFIMNDGSMSYAYHIPGRQAIWDELDPLENAENFNAENINKLGDIKNFHFKSYSQQSYSNDMEYWENAHEYYPDTESFSSPVYKDEDGNPAKVRHHRFPKNDNPDFRVIESTTTSSITTEIEPMPTKKIRFTSAAINQNKMEDLNITFYLNDGSTVGPNSGYLDDHDAFYCVEGLGDLVPGSTYVIQWGVDSLLIPDWTGLDPGGAYLAECLAVDDSGWVLFDHSQAQASGIWGDLGFSGPGYYGGDSNIDNNFPNDFNLYNDENVNGHIHSSPLAGAAVSISEGGTVSDSVRALGFTLENIKIPQEIANKVQGFRIYYADRQHANKRILGQGVVTPYDKVEGQIGGCSQNNTGAAGVVQNFWIKTPLRFNDGLYSGTAPNDGKQYQMLSFYNFELLRTQKSISPATHIAPQWISTYHTFLGPGAHHLESNAGTGGSACDVEIINSRFYIASNYDFSVGKTYKVLKERCKTYVNGDSILDASGHGFGYKLYNQGGETHIALGLAGNSSNGGFLERVNTAGSGNETPIVDNKSSYLGEIVKAYTVNLEAFKTDVYNTIDSQNLIWTGFEIKGLNLENFIIGGEGDFAVGALSGGRSLKDRSNRRSKASRNAPEVASYVEEAGGVVFHAPFSSGGSYYVFTEFDICNSAGLTADNVIGDPGTLDYSCFYDSVTAEQGMAEFNAGPAFDLTGHTDWKVPTENEFIKWSWVMGPYFGFPFEDQYSSALLSYFNQELVLNAAGTHWPELTNNINLGRSYIRSHTYIGIGPPDNVYAECPNDLGTTFGLFLHTAKAGHATIDSLTENFYYPSGHEVYDLWDNIYTGGGAGSGVSILENMWDPRIRGAGCSTSAITGETSNTDNGHAGWVRGMFGWEVQSIEAGDWYGSTNFRNQAEVDSNSHFYQFVNQTQLFIAPRYGRLKGWRHHYAPAPPDPIMGCTDPAAINYNPDATMADHSCEYAPEPPPECGEPVGSGGDGVILGGDTFICKYGFRQTLTPRVSTYNGAAQVSTFFTIIESTDNINFRHEEDSSTTYFPGSSMQKVSILDRDGKTQDLENLFDLTGPDKIKYNADYSLVNNTRPAFVLPNLITAPSKFTTRIHRSAKSDPRSLIDNYRIFLSQEHKDMARNRGSLWTLSTFNNLLYIHMEDSLFVTKGKQTMSMKDGSEAFIGTGDIFAQTPDELVQTEHGYGGTQSQFSTLVTKYGYFSVDERNKKVFLTTNKMTEISNLGMEKWFYNNLAVEKDSHSTYTSNQYELAEGLTSQEANISSLTNMTDSPITGKGLISAWDEKYQRILLTKRALILTERGRSLRNKGGKGVAGGLIYDTDAESYKLLFEPSVSLLQNGNFEAGNELISKTNFEFTTFLDIEPLPSSFFWRASRPLHREVINNILELKYNPQGYIYQFFNLEKDKNYNLEITWKGDHGIHVSLEPLNAILNTASPESDFITTTVPVRVRESGSYRLKIHGGIDIDATLYIKEISLKDAGYSGWSLDSGWTITNEEAINSGTSAGHISQTVPVESGKNHVLTFTISRLTTGSLKVFYGKSAPFIRNFVSNGTYTIEDVWQGEDSELSFYASGGFDGAIDSVIFNSTPALSYVVSDPVTNYYLDTKSIVSDSPAIQSVFIPSGESVSITSKRKAPRSMELPEVGDTYQGAYVYEVEPIVSAQNIYNIHLAKHLPDTYRYGCLGKPYVNIPMFVSGPSAHIMFSACNAHMHLVAQQDVSVAGSSLQAGEDLGTEYNVAAESARQYGDGNSNDWALPNTGLLEKALEMYVEHHPEELEQSIYHTCEKGDPEGRQRSIYVVRYIANTYSNNGTPADDLHANTIGLPTKFLPVHRTNSGYSSLLANIQLALSLGHTAAAIFSGMQINPAGYFASLGVEAPNTALDDFTDQNFDDLYFNDDLALGQILDTPQGYHYVTDGPYRTRQLADYIKTLYTEVNFTPATTGAASWGELFDVVNVGTPFRNLGNEYDSSVKINWHIPTKNELTVIAKNCTRYPSENGDSEGSDVFIHHDKGWNMIGASSTDAVATYLTESSTDIIQDAAMDTAGYSNKYRTTSYIMGSSSLLKFNESGNVYFYGVDIGREGHAFGAQWRRDVHLTGVSAADNSDPVNVSEQETEYIPISPTNTADYILTGHETGPSSDNVLRPFEADGSHETRVYAFHQCAELDETTFPEIADKEVGDEFDIDPITGAVSPATYGVNTVKVYMDRSADSLGSAGDIFTTDWYMTPGNVEAGGVATIRNSLAIDKSNLEVINQDVTNELGVIVIRNQAWEPSEEEVIIEEVIEPTDPVDPKTDIWERVGWTISFYPELNSWGSLHDYLPHLYSYTSKTLYSFYNWKDYPTQFWNDSGWVGNANDESWGIWEHNRSENPGLFYGPSEGSSIDVNDYNWIRPFEVEVIENKERDVSKVYSSFAYETEVYAAANTGTPNLNQIRYKRLDKDGFTSFFVYNNTQHSGNINIRHLENVRKVGHLWNINKFRDMSKIWKSTLDGYTLQTVQTSGFDGYISATTFASLSGESVGLDYVGNQDVHDMFEATWGTNGAYTIFTHPYYIADSKPWNEKRKFADTYLGIRLIHNNVNKNFVNLYSTSVGMRKHNR
tara:strand:+ start:2427 stop:11591 length:9165 start_codon:yes stop_codon:yes gene_type:complete